MPKRAKRNAALVLAALAALHLLLFESLGRLLAGRPAPPPGYYQRCGAGSILWILASYGSASLGCFIAAGVLVFTAVKRERGHKLNGVSYSWACFAAACGLALASPFLNLRSAPCWVAPALTGLVTATAWLVAYHTMLRRPVLVQTPNFELAPLIEQGKQELRKHNESPAEADLAPILGRILKNLEEYRSTVESLHEPGEGT